MTIDALIEYWSRQPHSQVGQATLDHLERYKAALEKIVEQSPAEDPGDFEYTGNADDNRDYGIARTHWRLAEICRHALTESHDSDCATNNAPALQVGPCDCSLNQSGNSHE